MSSTAVEQLGPDLLNPYKDKGERGYHIISRLFTSYLSPYATKIFAAVFCMVVVAITTSANAWIIRPILDDVFLQQKHDALVHIVALTLIIAATKGTASYFQNILMKFIGQRMVLDMQLHLYEHLLHADLELLGRYSSGKLLSRFTNDAAMIRGATSGMLVGIAKELLSIIFLFGVMIYHSPVLSFITFGIFPIAILPIIRLGRKMRKIAYKTQGELGQYTAILDDTFQNIKMVKSYQRESFELVRSRSIIENIFNFYMKAARIESISSPAMEVFSGIAIALVVWYGGSQVISGHTTTGSFFSFLGALLFAYRPIKSLADLNTSLQEGLAAARRFFQLLDTRPMIIDSPNAKALQIKGGSILIYDVSFSYDGTRALDGLSLNIPAGKTVALVGPSGGGKTTIMRLLLRFFDVQSGSVSIDGQDIRDITLHSLRDAIAVVTQDTILFDDTVMANILYGKLNATKDEVVKAAKMALAHDFIMELPNGYDTMVGQGGAKLSGGQRQRIAIARAILKNSPILLLDEATSSLDNLSEQYIRRSLQALHSHHTILVIAHRLSTVEDADIIYMVDQGKVIEQGTHQELLAKQGKYACLYHCAE